jgi:hypothetical protein
MSRLSLVREGIQYGIALGGLIGATSALADDLAAVWWGSFVPRFLPIAVVGAYIALGAAGGGLIAGTYAVTHRRGASSGPEAHARIREACFIAWAAMFVLFLLERSLPAEAALAIAGLGLLAAVGARWKFRFHWSSDRDLIWRVFCLALTFVLWYPLKDRGSSDWVGGVLLMRQGALALATATLLLIGCALLRRWPVLGRVATTRACLVRAAAIGLFGLAVGSGIVWARSPRVLVRSAPTTHGGTFCTGQGKPNVILVSLDTIRADHLSLYGYHRSTSPNLENFAREAQCY